MDNYLSMLILIVLLSFNINWTFVQSFICEHKCNCIQSSGKFTANCSNQGFTNLPKCREYEPELRNVLQSIQVLSLNQNNLQKLQAYQFHDACLDNLQKLHIQQAQIYDIDDLAFLPLTNIVELSLADNLLSIIPTKALENLNRLQTLDLSSNRINAISNDSFKTLINLRKLSLANNNISYVDSDAFNGLLNLNIINLSNNQLTILKPELFRNLKSLHSLFLEGNQWKCNCFMQPFKRMLLIKSRIQIHDKPRCHGTSVIWNSLALDHFQCAPRILQNYTETELTVSEGSTLRLKCAIYTETFGDELIDKEYLSLSRINWYWNNNVPITNDSKGCDHNCKNLAMSTQHFQIDEIVQEYNSSFKLKISTLSLTSIMTLNKGHYRCSVVNHAGSDELFFKVNVIPFYRSSNVYYEHKPLNGNNKNPVLIPGTSLTDPQASSYNKNIINNNDENADHVLFGLVLGILSGLFLVLVIFSIMFVFFVKKRKIISTSRHPQELIMIGDVSSTLTGDNNTVIGDDDNHDTQTETTERNASQNEINPLLIVNPVKKPPRLGIPDISAIYAQPSWSNTMNHSSRANNNLQMLNRSRYASYAETEPTYSDYHPIYQRIPNRNLSMPRRVLSPNPLAVINDNDHNTFISDTASEV